LLHSFYSFDYVLKLSLRNITRLLIKADYKNNENLLRQRWMLHYQGEMTFQDFKDKIVSHKTKNNKTEEEILKEVKDIINTFNGEVKS